MAIHKSGDLSLDPGIMAKPNRVTLENLSSYAEGAPGQAALKVSISYHRSLIDGAMAHEDEGKIISFNMFRPAR